ncbi:MAG: homocysteine S-methyltransferase family protein, partial [Desulfovibrionaceae bacterium]|nr:homocysteine S-methyltransferase family protein [Desulfovibrionaceae bacterium]
MKKGNIAEKQRGCVLNKFTDFLNSSGFICFDGGMGTMLQTRGLLPGMSPEFFCLENSDILVGIHREYIEAGADIITTNTFGGTRLKLPAGLDTVEFNRRMASLAREAAEAGQKAAGRPVFVAGSVGPTGHFIRPLGEMSFREMVDVFREQIRGLARGGVDLILAETHFDLAELKAVVVAAREECSSLPIGVSMTFEAGMSLTGTPPQVYKETMLNMGVDLIGTNCSAGPREMQPVVKELLNDCPVPVLIEPNAGLPELEDGKTVFRLGAEEFSTLTAEFAAKGARLLGGCCGTTPTHIAALRRKLNALPAPAPICARCDRLAVTSRSRVVFIGADEPLQIIGERINPTGKKLLSAELQQGQFSLALRYADQQTLAGAPILDINVGAPGVDETILLPQLVEKVAGQTPLPLCLDSANPR